MTIWKELKVGNYKNYTYRVLGCYGEHVYSIYRGTEYTDNIETKVEIRNLLGEVVHSVDWLEHYEGYESYDTYKYLIRFRLIRKASWWRLAPKVIGLIHIKDDYYRVLNDWSKYCERKINELINDYEKELYQQQLTDGLPNSVFNKYLDR